MLLLASVKDLSAVDDMMHTVLESTQRTLDVDGAAVYQLTSDGDEGERFSFAGAIGNFWPTSSESDIVFTKRKYADYALENSHYRMGEGVIGLVAERKTPRRCTHGLGSGIS